MSRLPINDDINLDTIASLVRDDGYSARAACIEVARRIGTPNAVERLRRKWRERRGVGRVEVRLSFTQDEWERLCTPSKTTDKVVIAGYIKEFVSALYS